MSQYLTIQGEISFSKKVDFNKAVKILEAGGWLGADGSLVDEMGRTQGNEEDNGVDCGGMSVRFPYSSYRNIMMVLPDILALRSCKGYLKATTTDGDFRGFSYANGLSESVDLNDWASKNTNTGKPLEEEYSEEDDYYEALNDWQNEVECSFHD
jgi:hypothetical protein